MFMNLDGKSPLLTCQMFGSYGNEKRHSCLVKSHAELAEHVAAVRLVYITSLASITVIPHWGLFSVSLWFPSSLLYLTLLPGCCLWTPRCPLHQLSLHYVSVSCCSSNTLALISFRFSPITLETSNCTADEQYRERISVSAVMQCTSLVWAMKLFRHELGQREVMATLF